MSPSLISRLLPMAVAVLSCSDLACAAADVAQPKLREKVVDDAVRLASEREVLVPLPSPLPNPFVAKQEEQVEEHAPAAPSAAEPALAGGDLLAMIAARIPSTGTVIIGGEPILLLGQKRLKVGDTFAISFEGRTYELSIAAVNPTSFTVKRGENIYTRPVRISAASASTPTNRP